MVDYSPEEAAFALKLMGQNVGSAFTAGIPGIGQLGNLAARVYGPQIGQATLGAGLGTGELYSNVGGAAHHNLATAQGLTDVSTAIPRAISSGIGQTSGVDAPPAGPEFQGQQAQTPGAAQTPMPPPPGGGGGGGIPSFGPSGRTLGALGRVRSAGAAQSRAAGQVGEAQQAMARVQGEASSRMKAESEGAHAALIEIQDRQRQTSETFKTKMQGLQRATRIVNQFNVDPNEYMALEDKANDTSLPMEEREAAQRRLAGMKVRGKVDPMRMFRGNTQRQVLAILGTAMGAFGAALTGTPNFALQTIEAAIDRDLEVQQREWAARRSGVQQEVGMAKDAYSLAMDQFDDEKTARLAAKALMLEAIGHEADALSATAKGNEAMANANMLKAGVQERINGQLASVFLEIDKGMWSAETARIKAAGKAGAPAKDAAKFRGNQQVLAELHEEYKKVAGGTGEFALNWLSKRFGGMTEAGRFETKSDITAQIFGKQLEGRMTDQDFLRFQSFMPRADDTQQAAQEKVQFMMGVMEQYAAAYENGWTKEQIEAAGGIEAVRGSVPSLQPGAAD